MALSKDTIPVTRITMEDGREYKAIGHHAVIGLLLRDAKEGGWDFTWHDAQDRKYTIPSKEISKGFCKPDGVTRR